MKIALLDLNHMTRGVHTIAVPLGCGLIASYLHKNVDPDLDVQIFKDPAMVSQALYDSSPDIVGLAQYTWNSELNLLFARAFKQASPGCLIIAGGPNLELEPDLKRAYLRKHPEVDICVSFDGEIPMAEIVRRTLAGENAEGLREEPVPGSYALSARSGELREPNERPPRLDSLDACGSIYAEGLFDKMFDDGFHPFVQTHRGCPFTCTFCHTSDRYYARMLFQSPEVFAKDMDHLGKHFAGKHNVTLYIANTNMSMFDQDFEIARIIQATQEKYDWPRIINVNSGKDPDKLLRMLGIINYQPAIALQTLTPAVLENIHRKNIPFERFTEFQLEVARHTGESSATELILCLPGETKATFLETLRKVMNSGIQNIVVYTLMCLKGSPLASPGSMKKYECVVKHRVVPRQFSEIDLGNTGYPGIRTSRVFDTEEVIVQTNTMSFEDYIELRGVCFTLTAIFSSAELIPLKRLLIESGLDVADWLFTVHAGIGRSQDLYANYENFLKETRDELFNSRGSLIRYFSEDENFQALCEGRLGDNLLRKYKLISLSENFSEVLDLACEVAQEMLAAKYGNDAAGSVMSSMRTFLSSRDMRTALEAPDTIGSRQERLEHDIPGWLETKKRSSPGVSAKGDGGIIEHSERSADRVKELIETQRPLTFDVTLSEYAKERIKGLVSLNKDVELSLQMLYRDGTISDLWPEWRSAGTRS